MSRDGGRGSSRDAADVQVGSVARAVDALHCFDDVDDLGVTEIAHRLGIAKSSASRLLRTLCAAGLVEQDSETGRYSLGLELFELGQRAASRHALHAAARPVLNDVCAESGLTAALVLPTPHGVIHLDRAEPAEAIRFWAGRGSAFPPFGAGGHVIRAHRRQPDEAAATSPGTRQPAKRSRPNVNDTRAAGYALEFGQVISDVASLAVPVCRLGRAEAAIAIIGPDRPFSTRAAVNRLVSLAALAARTVERATTGPRALQSNNVEQGQPPR